MIIAQGSFISSQKVTSCSLPLILVLIPPGENIWTIFHRANHMHCAKVFANFSPGMAFSMEWFSKQ